MANENTTELVMFIKDANGTCLDAEGQSSFLDPNDPLLTDFKPGKFFAIDEFAFGMNIDDQDATSDAANTGGRQGVAPAPAKRNGPPVKFGSWKTAPPEQVAKMKFPLRVDEFSVVRAFDRASPVLFQSCARSITFDSAALVKRKIIGSSQLETFWRMDFQGILVTHVGWDDAEVIKETMRFVFRGIQVQYRRQLADGSLVAPGSAEWNFDVKLRNKATSPR